MKSYPLIFLSLIIALLSCTKNEKIPIYKDPNANIEARITDLLAKMTLEQKVKQLAGHGLATDPDTILGIPSLLMTDGPLGVRTEKATAFPAGEALAASWDTALAAKVGKAIALEVKGKGLNMLLGPCVDIHRLPVNGRNFEGYGEDPYLSSRLAVSYIKSAQSQGIATCVKHFVLENHQWERMKFDNRLSQRALHEIYFPPFKAAIDEAGSLSIMAAYNKINGQFGSENSYCLKDVLKGDWNFKGLVVSDWDATHNTIAAAKGGLDVEMPQPVHFGDSLLQAVKSGFVSEEEINDKVKRVLRVKFTAGMFDNAASKDTNLVNSDYSKQIALESAKAGIVLLKNENNILPLDKNKLKSIAVIGPNAKKCRSGGGGSSLVIPYYKVSPFDGLQNKVGNAITLNYALGDELDKKEIAPIDGKYFYTDPSKTTQGLTAEYFNNISLTGTPVVTRTETNINYVFNDASPIPDKVTKDMFGIRWTGYIISPVPKKYKIATLADDGVRLYIDDVLQFENWDFHGTEKDSVEIFLDQNKPHKIVLEYFDGQMGANVKLTWDHDAGTANTTTDLIGEAVAAAKKSDVAILFLGSSESLESEANDYYDHLKLPNKQEQLIKAVSKANPNTILVINGGIPINVSGVIGNVKAFVDALYLGQETGNALADMLFGDYNPSAKLPFSYVAKSEDAYGWAGMDKKNYVMDYKEGIYVGYRNYEKNNIKPLFPFGHGLSYSTFEYSVLEVSDKSANNFDIKLNVKNTSAANGSEVVQVYVSPKNPTIDRPIKELKAFAKSMVNAGETITLTIPLSAKSFAYYHPDKKQWVTDAGDYEILVGASSADIKLKQTITIK
ncbi:MAG: glycoside hydrolase family 3 C-terminal domain-containing protein [Cytophagales bacterium]|nr:glycoside hydrolase family 3 C-terminal domain-containing protein [Cytophagales bacterium]